MLTETQLRHFSGEIDVMTQQINSIKRRVAFHVDHLKQDTIERLLNAAKDKKQPHNPHQKADDQVPTRLATRQAATIRAAREARRLYGEMTDSVTAYNSLPLVQELEKLAYIIHVERF